MVLERNWEHQAPMYSRIYSRGTADYASTLIDLEKAFQLRDRRVRCIDEGTPGGIRLTGLGILLGFDKAIEVLREAKVEGVHPHEGCGACDLHAKKVCTETKPDEIGIEWGKKLAAELGVPYSGFISADAMSRPREGHIARAAYYDGTGRFDCTGSLGLPPGFVVSRRHLNNHVDYARSEAEIAITIALGPHGYGMERITDETPFMLVAIGDPADPMHSTERLMDELRPLELKLNGAVRVDGFTAPGRRI